MKEPVFGLYENKGFTLNDCKYSYNANSLTVTSENLSAEEKENIANMYLNYGMNFIRRADYNRSFYIFDAKKKRVLLVRDRIGNDQVYYFFNRKRLLFSSDINLLKKHVKTSINKKALHYFLKFGFIPRKTSIFNGIKKLLPGYFLLFDGKNIKTKKYWDIDITEKDYNEKECVKKLESLLNQTIKSSLPKGEKVSVLASGGLDSSLLLSLTRNYTGNIDAIFIEFDDKKHEEYNRKSFEAVSEISNKLGINHFKINIKLKDFLNNFHVVIGYLNEPVFDKEIAALFFASKKMAKNTKLISGWGADELFSLGKKEGYINLKMKIPEMLSIHNKIYGINSMEFQTPFFDPRLVNFAFTLKPEMKTRNNIKKYILTLLAEKTMPAYNKIMIAKSSTIDEEWESALIEKYRKDVIESEFLNKHLKRDYIEKCFKCNKDAIKLIILDLWGRANPV